jgi:hypothetical protein
MEDILLYRRALGLSCCLAWVTLVAASSGCSSTPTLATADAAAGADANIGPGSDGGVGTSFDAAMWGDVHSVPASCGSLDPATASQLVLTRIDDILLPAAETLGMIDTSTALARFFNEPQTSSVTFAADTKTAVNELADDLSEQWLVAANVESADGGQVTYLLTTDDGGAGNEPPCGTDAGVAPLRLRVSRIGCDAGDAVEVELLAGTDQTRLLAFELGADRIYGRLFVGDWINAGKQMTETSCSGYELLDGGWVTSSMTTVTTVFDPGATGVVAAEVDVADGGPAHAALSMIEPMSIGWSPADGGAHQSVVVASDDGAMIDVTVDPNAGTIAGSLGSGAATVTTTLADFIREFFDNRSLVPSANPNDPVAVSVPGVAGSFAYAASVDQFTFHGLGWNGQPALAVHGTDTLLRADLAPNAGGLVNFTATAGADAGVDMSFLPPVSLAILYNLASVANEVSGLPPFAQNDLVSIVLGGQNPSVIRLGPASSSSSYGGGCNQTWFQVRSGQLDMTSTFAPSGAVHVASPQCLVQTACGESDTQDWLSAVSAAGCP